MSESLSAGQIKGQAGPFVGSSAMLPSLIHGCVSPAAEEMGDLEILGEFLSRCDSSMPEREQTNCPQPLVFWSLHTLTPTPCQHLFVTDEAASSCTDWSPDGRLVTRSDHLEQRKAWSLF